MWNPCVHKIPDLKMKHFEQHLESFCANSSGKSGARRVPACTKSRKLLYMEHCMHKTWENRKILEIQALWVPACTNSHEILHFEPLHAEVVLGIEACWAPGNYSILSPCMHHKTPGNYRIFELLYAQHLQRLSPCMQFPKQHFEPLYTLHLQNPLIFTSFRALAYTKLLDLTRNLSKLRVISCIVCFDLAERASCARKPAQQAANAELRRAMTLSIKGLKIVSFSGQTCTMGTRQEKPANLILYYIRGPEKNPEGPKIEKIQDFAPRLKLSSDQSQIEIFNRDWNFQARLKIRLLLWGIIKVGIEIFKRDWNFQSRLKFSILDWNFQAYGLKISRDQSGLNSFQSQGPLGNIVCKR